VKQQQLTGMIEFGQFALSQLQPYLSPYVNATLKQGSAGVSGNFEVNADQSIVFNGQANVSSLTVEDGVKQEPLLEWQDMQVSGIDYRSEENAFSVAKVELKKPYAKLIIDSTGQTNVSDIVVQQTDVESTNAAKEHSPQDVSEQQQESSQSDPLQQSSSAMAIRIDEISLLDGSAYFEDNSLRPRFASGIEALNGAITGLASSGESPADVNIEGKIDGYAPVALSGAINPLLEEMYLDLHFSVSGAELTSVNPYSGTYMGHFIDKGLLSLDVDYSLENNQLEGQNHVVIDQLTLGRKTDSDQALSLPLGLAIALLQDSDGVIDLGMEVSGDLNNPSFGFGAIIFKAIGNLITKAVTAPFSFLANLVGSDDELNEIAFPDGSAELSDDISEKLTTLAQALAKRPGLRVNIEGTVDEVEDAYELAEQKVQQQLLALSAEQALPADLSSSTLALASPFGEALSTLFTTSTNKQVDEERQVVKMRLEQSDSSEANEQSVVSQEQVDQALVIAMYNQVRSSINISRRELGNLADSRAKAVKTFLVNSANVDTKRLFLLNSRQHLQRDKSGVTLTLEAN
jgi:outer membrane protein OmpA-like peptidoglycan-associated protein